MTKMVALRDFGWKGKLLAAGTEFEAEANRVAGLVANQQASIVEGTRPPHTQDDVKGYGKNAKKEGEK